MLGGLGGASTANARRRYANAGQQGRSHLLGFLIKHRGQSRKGTAEKKGSDVDGGKEGKQQRVFLFFLSFFFSVVAFKVFRVTWLFVISLNDRSGLPASFLSDTTKAAKRLTNSVPLYLFFLPFHAVLLVVVPLQSVLWVEVFASTCGTVTNRSGLRSLE